MKGIILAGGRATRLMPLTKITSKQLLPVYDRPMIYYPIETLRRAGITDVLIIVAPEYSGQFLNLLGSGKDFGMKFTYEIQEEARGLADAFLIAEKFIGNDSVTMILGDNIFFGHDFSEEIRGFTKGAMVFAKEVQDPQRYGVVQFDEQNRAINIEEKPLEPKSPYAVVGLYVYDSRVVEFAKGLQPSARNELEIVDLHNAYLKRGELKVNVIEGFWEDAGTFESFYRANSLAREFALGLNGEAPIFEGANGNAKIPAANQFRSLEKQNAKNSSSGVTRV